PPYSVFSDSLEVYGADWTPGFLQEFRKRRGYDLLPYLPDLFAPAPDAQALAVRHDWGVTLTELIDENYLSQITTWAHAHHTLFRSQTYGPPAVSLSSNALVDLPEGEGPQWRQFSFTRWATSASHIYGRPITSSETWTWLHSPAFRATPLDMKQEADRFFLQGINQLMGHGWPYSPPSAGEPGWRFYAAGAFNAHNPWWIVMPDVTRYLQRVSWALREGEPANQVAIYLPEDDAWAAFTPGKVAMTKLMPRWITPALTQAIEDAGYNFDYIDAAAIAARGIPYPVLILPNVDRMSPDTLARIAGYIRDGGKVIALGRIPEHAPGFVDYATTSARVTKAAQTLFDGGNKNARVVADATQLGEVLHTMVPPDMQLTPAANQVGFIRRKLPGADLYFIANTGNTPVRAEAHLRSKYMSGEWLNPDTGATRAARSRNGEFPLHLAPYGSAILLLHTGSPAGASEMTVISHDIPIADLSESWRVSFGGTKLDETMPQLVSWTRNEKTRYYSGVVIYSKEFDLPEAALHDAKLILSFGKGAPINMPPGATNAEHTHAWFDPPIREAAVVYVNGKRAGSLWHPPYELDVTTLLKPGRNRIDVHVANTAINELAGESLPDYRLLWARYGRRFVPQDMDHLKPVPSGLLGKVELLQRSKR
ncbi:MAG TPA: glycosyl hydrolase, partial [Acidobacteriaceae bacterium]|nr:glycosyl hydrolase [Acidobacteriaceae bacterium]